MARKATIDSLIKQAEEQDIKVHNIEVMLNAAKEKQTELWKKVSENKAEMEQERFNELAKVAIEKFGENVSPEQFKEMLDTIMINDEVSDYVKSEKAKQQSLNDKNSITDNLEK